MLQRAKQYVHGRLRNVVHSSMKDVLENQGEINYQVNEIRKSQLEINHTTTSLLKEINERVKNSGIIHLSESVIVAKIFTGLKVYLDPRDVAVSQHLALDGIWEHEISQAWLRVVRRNDTVLDIGANYGYYGLLAAQLTDKKDSKVVMFEPNSDLIPYIQKSLDLNWLHEQCVVENFAVSSNMDDITLHVLDGYIGSSSVLDTKDVRQYMDNKMTLTEAKAVTVKAITIDEYCKRHKIASVDLIKMDIEGFEEEAYMGMRRIIAASAELTMFLEFTPKAYKQPKRFWKTILEDFPYVYTINKDGTLHACADASYDMIIGTTTDWVMPVFSKRADLAND